MKEKVGYEGEIEKKRTEVQKMIDQKKDSHDINKQVALLTNCNTRGGPKVTGLFIYLKLHMKYKFFLNEIYKFPEICYFYAKFHIKLSFVTTEIS